MHLTAAGAALHDPVAVTTLDRNAMIQQSFTGPLLLADNVHVLQTLLACHTH